MLPLPARYKHGLDINKPCEATRNGDNKHVLIIYRYDPKAAWFHAVIAIACNFTLCEHRMTAYHMMCLQGDEYNILWFDCIKSNVGVHIGNNNETDWTRGNAWTAKHGWHRQPGRVFFFQFARLPGYPHYKTRPKGTSSRTWKSVVGRVVSQCSQCSQYSHSADQDSHLARRWLFCSAILSALVGISARLRKKEAKKECLYIYIYILYRLEYIGYNTY